MDWRQQFAHYLRLLAISTEEHGGDGIKCWSNGYSTGIALIDADLDATISLPRARQLADQLDDLAAGGPGRSIGPY